MKKIFFPFAAASFFGVTALQGAFIIDDFSDNISTTVNSLQLTDHAENAAGRDFDLYYFSGGTMMTLQSDGSVMRLDTSSGGAFGTVVWNGPGTGYNLNMDLSAYDQFQFKAAADRATSLLFDVYTSSTSTSLQVASILIPIPAGNLNDLNTYSIPFSSLLAQNSSLDFSDVDLFAVAFYNLTTKVVMDDIEATTISPVPEAHHYGLASGAVCLGLALLRRKLGGLRKAAVTQMD